MVCTSAISSWFLPRCNRWSTRSSPQFAHFFLQYAYCTSQSERRAIHATPSHRNKTGSRQARHHRNKTRRKTRSTPFTTRGHETRSSSLSQNGLSQNGMSQNGMMMMLREHTRRSHSAMRSLLLSTLSICSSLMQSSIKTVTPSWVALGPSPALSNPDKGHMPSASLAMSHHVSHISRSEAERVAVAPQLTTPWTCAGRPTQSGTTMPPCICIAGPEPGIVSASSSAFHVLWFSSSSSVSHVSLRISRIHTQAPCTQMEAHTSCCDLREHAVDGSIVIRWDWHFDPPFFLHLIIASILSLHPIRSCVTFVQSVPTHCATACSHLHTLNRRP